jgi:hypothetical protein
MVHFPIARIDSMEYSGFRLKAGKYALIKARRDGEQMGTLAGTPEAWECSIGIPPEWRYRKLSGPDPLCEVRGLDTSSLADRS